MKYKVIINNKERELEITRCDKELYRVVVDGESHQIDARICAPGLFSVLIEKYSYDISFVWGDSNVQLSFRNNFFDIEILEELKFQIPSEQSELEISGFEKIRTSMPGKVVRVLVEKGQIVAPGTEIVIIESMKMENEIRCRSGGIVKAINVSAGELVESDVVLFEIEP